MTLRDFVRQIGLDHAHPFVGAAAPAVRLRAATTGAIGSSRLGGLPDLPADLVWPCWNAGPYFTLEARRARKELPHAGNARGRAYWQEQIDRYEARAAAAPRPLSFVGQLNCADLAPSELPLPRSGLLSFFYDLDEQPWGYAPEHAGAWKVVFTPPDVPLSRRELPAHLDGQLVLRPKGLQPVPTWTFPLEVTADGVPLWNRDDPDVEPAFGRLADADPEPRHQVGGHPDPLQGDMAQACALVSQGVNLGDPPELSDEDIERLTASAPEWRLLFQIASDDEIELMWGDGGKLYFWMRDADIASGAWDRAWVQLQSC